MEYCKKLILKTTNLDKDDEPVTLYGLIEKEDKDFLIFRTGRKTYTISKRCLLSIEPTEIPFRNLRGECNYAQK